MPIFSWALQNLYSFMCLSLISIKLSLSLSQSLNPIFEFLSFFFSPHSHISLPAIFTAAKPLSNLSLSLSLCLSATMKKNSPSSSTTSSTTCHCRLLAVVVVVLVLFDLKASATSIDVDSQRSTLTTASSSSRNQYINHHIRRHLHYHHQVQQPCDSLYHQQVQPSLCVRFQRLHHQFMNQRRPPFYPPPFDHHDHQDHHDEIDPRYGVEKRLVPSGPNPLHN